jgi:lipopolysaccharide export system permease protein
LRRLLPIPLLDILVLKDLFPFFLTGIALFSGLWFAADPLLKAGQYLSEGTPFMLVAQVVWVYLPTILGITLPMAMLLAVLQGFGRLSGDSEAVALFAAGVPFVRVAVPAVMMGLVASLIGYGINDRVASAAANNKAHLEEQISRYAHVASSELIHEPLYFETTSNGVLQYFVQIQGGVDAKAGTMHDVTINFYDSAGKPAGIVYATQAKFLGTTPDDLKHWLLSGVTGVYINVKDQSAVYFQTNTSQTSPATSLLGPRLQAALNESPAAMALLGRDPQTLNFAETRKRIQLLIASGRSQGEVRAAQSDYWSRIALPERRWACARSVRRR